MDRLRPVLLALAFLLFGGTAAWSQTCGTLTTCPFASTPLSGTELMYMVQGGVSKKITSGQFIAGIGGNVSNSGTPTSGQLAEWVSATAIKGLTPGTGILTALGNALNSSGGIPAPTPAEAGDLIYWNGSAWTKLVGNSSGTQVLQETSLGVPSWVTPSGGGSGSACTQDFLAATNFTPGSTTSLTTTCTPSSTASLSIYFDGLRQSADTWTLSISTVTFNAPIPANVQVVEFQAGVPSAGSVTSVGLSLPSFITVTNSPVTTTGTLTGTLATQTANTGFMGPASGSAAAPTFRALVAADIPISISALGGTLIPAACNGSTNDTTTINNALTSLATKGGKGYLPVGQCIISGTIVIPSNVTLIGQGSSFQSYIGGGAPTVLYWAGGQSAPIVQMGVSGNSIEAGLEDITLDGQSADGSYAGVSMDSCFGDYFRNVAIQNVGTGISMNNTYGAVDDDCAWNTFYTVRITNVGTGLYMYAASGGYTTDNVFYDLQIFNYDALGIDFEQYCDSNTFFNMFSQNNPATIQSSYGIVLNNTVQTSDVGVYSENFYNGSISVSNGANSDNQYSIIVNDTTSGFVNFFQGSIALSGSHTQAALIQNGGSMYIHNNDPSGGNTGVHCSGSPTSSFATDYFGAVTHC